MINFVMIVDTIFTVCWLMFFVRHLMMNVKLQDLAMDQTEVVFTHFYVPYHDDA